jgi:hypothetical protein
MRALLSGFVVGCLVVGAATWLLAPRVLAVVLAGAATTAERIAAEVAGPAVEPPEPERPTVPWPERFGVALPGDPRLLSQLGARWYYDYQPVLRDAPRDTVKVAMLRAGERDAPDLARVRAEARARPGRYWLVFNEPDLLEQDGVSDAFLAARGEERFAYYARRYHEYRTALRAADPTAKLVGPNLFNLDERFDVWLDAFRAAYRGRYGEEPTFDVWGFHIYALDWQRHPMLDRAYALRTIERFRAYVAALPGRPGRIWLTEFGTLWAWDQPPECVRPDCACAAADPEDRCREHFAVPSGARYAATEVADYVAWLVDELAARGVERWFFFAGKPYVDPPFVAPAGFANGASLFDAQNRRTAVGDRYRALIQRGPPSSR